MTEEPNEDTGTSFEKAIKNLQDKKYVLRLYVTGNTPRSVQAIMNLRKLCDEYLEGRYELEIIDISQQPGIARRDDIIATPTLVKSLPDPVQRFIGDLSQTERILVGLNLIEVKK